MFKINLIFLLNQTQFHKHLQRPASSLCLHVKLCKCMRGCLSLWVSCKPYWSYLKLYGTTGHRLSSGSSLEIRTGNSLQTAFVSCHRDTIITTIMRCYSANKGCQAKYILIEDYDTFWHFLEWLWTMKLCTDLQLQSVWMSSSVMVGLVFLWAVNKVPHDVAVVGFIVNTLLSCNFLETEVGL